MRKGFFHVEEINSRLIRITDVADTHMYLVLGDNESALLDTGVGVGDLRDLVKKLTDKPVKVLITHGHIDHAMGAGQFEKVYMNKKDHDLYIEHSDPDMRVRYIHGVLFGDPENPETAFVTKEMLQQPKPISEFHPMNYGDCFDLGGITIKTLDGHGHTPGCTIFLIPELRMLLTGDACNPFTFLFDESCPSVTEYREMLLNLKKETDGAYDKILLNHGGDLEEPLKLIDSVIDVCDDILNGNTADEPFTGFHGETVNVAKAMILDMETGYFRRTDGKVGNVVYNPSNVR